MFNHNQFLRMYTYRITYECAQGVGGSVLVQALNYAEAVIFFFREWPGHEVLAITLSLELPC